MNKEIIFTALALAFIFSGCKSAPTAEPTLQELIMDGKIEEAKSRFTTKYDINEIDESGNTALHLAAAMNDSDLITFFLIKKADIDLKNYDSKTPLHIAIESGSFDAAQTLVSFGANIFARNGEGKTAIDMGFEKDVSYYDIFITTKTSEIRDAQTGRNLVHYLVQTKNEQGISTCIKKHIPLSVPDNEGLTPLDVAFQDSEDIRSIEIAAELIMNDADPVESDFDYFQTALQNRNLNYRFDDGQTPLHLAAIQGHTAVTRYILENNALTNVQDSSGATPLHEAIRYGHTDIAKLLLASGSDPNAKDNLGKTPILLIIPEEQRDRLYTLLINNNADVSIKDMYGDTVLHTATMTHVPTSILRQLLFAGADVNARNKVGVTPIAIAIENNVTEHVQFYAENGADINTKDTNGETPLTLALKRNDNILETVLNRLNVNSQDSDGNTPLNVAILNNASLQKIQYILSLTDDVNVRNSDGNTALYLAVLKNRQKLGELLLAKHGDIFATNNKSQSPLSLALNAGGLIMDWLVTSQTIKATDGSGNTALHYAAEWGLRSAISVLVQKGAALEAKNANGETPLFSAAKSDKAEVIDLLVSEGAKVNVRDNLGSTPLHQAVRWGNLHTATKLLSLGIDVDSQNVSGKSPLSEAAIAGKFDLAQLLLKAGADPNSSDTTGRTILMDSIRGRNENLVKLLLAYHANPQIQEINGRNAYHEAAASGDKKIITLILNAGGNPLSRDKAGNTPFSLSLREGNEVIKTVLGSDKTIADSDGNTPVHIITKSGCPTKLLTMLITNGYPFDTRNSDGYTPLGIAIENSNTEYSRILLENGANPFTMIDKKGKNPATIALEKKNDSILGNIVKHAGNLSDIQGNTILHYAARSSELAVIQKLLSYGLDTNVKNISGETPYNTAIRWKRQDAARILAPLRAN